LADELERYVADPRRALPAVRAGAAGHACGQEHETDDDAATNEWPFHASSLRWMDAVNLGARGYGQVTAELRR
jgi:hypothetical protein